MAHKKGVGSSKNGRESESKRLGVKIFGGQTAFAGNIIVRHRGTKPNPGEKITHFTLRWMVLLNSKRNQVENRSSLLKLLKLSRPL